MQKQRADLATAVARKTERDSASTKARITSNTSFSSSTPLSRRLHRRAADKSPLSLGALFTLVRILENQKSVLFENCL